MYGKCTSLSFISPQCAPPGCLIELCIQLSMIMLGKQLIQNNVFEVLIPYVQFHSYSHTLHPSSTEYPVYTIFALTPFFCSKLKKMYRTIQEEKVKKRAAENNEENEEEKRPKQQFDKDFTLEPFEGVSPEYMEMSESLFNSLSHSLLQSHKIYVFLFNNVSLLACVF